MAGGAIAGASIGAAGGGYGAGIGAAIGFGIGVGTYLYNQGELDKELTRYIRRYQEEMKAKLELMDLNFEINKKDALKNADNSDIQTTMQEGLVSEDFNNNLDALRLGQESDALGWNMQAIQNEMSEGDALSSMAISGTRGSSMNDAVEMQSSLNSQQLQLQEDTQRKGQDIQLASLLNNLANNTFNMQMSRNNAMDLRMAYDDGSVYGKAGDQYNLYTKNRALQEKAYLDQIDDLKRQRDDTRNWWKNTLGAIGAGFTGATTGANVGGKVDQFNYNLNGGGDAKNQGVNLWSALGKTFF